MKLLYSLHGLKFESDIPLHLCQEEFGPVACAIQWGIVPDHLEAACYGNESFEVSATQFLLKVQGVANFWVRDGRDITVELHSGGDPRNLEVFLLGSCLGALLQQRGRFILHASAVVGPNGVTALLAPSGRGKSTLAAWLNLRGYPLFCEDLCSLEISATGVTAWNSASPLKLWQNSLQALHLNNTDLEPVRPGLQRYFWSASQEKRGRLPLHQICLLRRWNETCTAARHLAPQDSLAAILRNRYRSQYLRHNQLAQRSFLQSTQLANQIPILEITRPNAGDSLAAVGELVLHELSR